MEPERKRKPEDRAESGTEEAMKKKKKERAEEEEKEVEEFFAILRRIHVALEYFQKADGRSRRELSAAIVNTWKPSFEVQDFKEVVGNPDSGLDLNSPTFN